MISLRCIVVLLALTGGTAELPAAEPASTADAALLRSWAQWRGPLANGVAPLANPPIRWSETENVRWRIALPGKAHSSPVVFGDQVFVTTAVPVGDAQKPVYDRAPGTHDNVPVTHRHQFMVLALDRQEGRVVWSRVLREAFPHEGGHNTGSLASNSPTTDGEQVYVHFGTQGLHVLGLDGTPKWTRDLGRMDTLHAHGEGSSPVVFRDSVFVNWDHE
ncbi:MAG: PQQ-binding-like beta-propeller repeat protein, partial [Verrucomicrobiales bacterium]|nr:PQQ-binding-like beta-propeller repeat protein [Verrucomicrobiales bacterium]